MRGLSKILIPFFICLVLGACASSQSDKEQALLMPMPHGPIDPSDEYVRIAVNKFLSGYNAPVASRYDIKRIDLDGDKRRDALVLFKTPYGYWCGMHGCTMLVMKAHDDNFTLVNGIQPIREPLYISEHKTNGWKDIITRVSGRWTKAKDVMLQYDGTSYPDNPSDLPACTQLAMNDTNRIFYD